MQESSQISQVISSRITLVVNNLVEKSAAEVIDEIRASGPGVLVINVPVHITSAILHRLADYEFKHCAVDLRF